MRRSTRWVGTGPMQRFWRVHHLPTSGDDEVGYRGIGEGGLIVAPATLVNAIEDALSPFGAVIEGQYLPPWRILELAGRC